MKHRKAREMKNEWSRKVRFSRLRGRDETIRCGEKVVGQCAEWMRMLMGEGADDVVGERPERGMDWKRQRWTPNSLIAVSPFLVSAWNSPLFSNSHYLASYNLTTHLKLPKSPPRMCYRFFLHPSFCLSTKHPFLRLESPHSAAEQPHLIAILSLLTFHWQHWS